MQGYESSGLGHLVCILCENEVFALTRNRRRGKITGQIYLPVRIKRNAPPRVPPRVKFRGKP